LNLAGLGRPLWWSPFPSGKYTQLKIYTRTGDDGETGLLGGVRVSKSHLAIEVCGSLDETNSHLGVALSQFDATGAKRNSPPATRNVRPGLIQIQNDLFDLGSRIAACESDSSRAAHFSADRSLQLERWIDEFQLELPELTAFILPGGCMAGASLHLARAVCRRSERALVALVETKLKADLSTELVYLNRLGDLLFVLARYINHAAGVGETKWSATRA
jgi:cob(I)alamin adenosyltransferase